MAEIIVVGAGISGLATAWFLGKRGHAVTVLEAAPMPGGCLCSEPINGFLVDAGPTSTLFRNGALDELVQDLGLRDALLEANRVADRRYIVRDGELRALPTGPLSFLTTPLFSPAGKLRMLLEPVHGRAAEEESVAQFVRRRLGQEFLDWGIDPFISGVYAGDPARLSVRAATAKVYALEAAYRSLFIGALARLLRGRPSGPQPTGRLVTFRDGMQSLPKAIAAGLGNRVMLAQAATAIGRRAGGGWDVRTETATHAAARLILAVPAYRAAELLAPLAPAAAQELAGIHYPPVASVALGFERAQVMHPLDGFGMLIPRRLGLPTLGALFSSTLFPGRAPAGKVLLTAFIGGARNEGIVALDEGALVKQILADLRPLLGILGSPVLTRVTLWRRAIPQYELGHLDRLARIDAALAPWPDLTLRANWRDGISVSDCVGNARNLASAIGPA